MAGEDEASEQAGESQCQAEAADSRWWISKKTWGETNKQQANKTQTSNEATGFLRWSETDVEIAQLLLVIHTQTNNQGRGGGTDRSLELTPNDPLRCRLILHISASQCAVVAFVSFLTSLLPCLQKISGEVCRTSAWPSASVKPDIWIHPGSQGEASDTLSRDKTGRWLEEESWTLSEQKTTEQCRFISLQLTTDTLETLLLCFPK